MRINAWGEKQYYQCIGGNKRNVLVYYNHDTRNKLLIQIQIYSNPANENLRIETLRGSISFISFINNPAF